MADDFTKNGKQILHRGEHFADAENENGAELILLALNHFDLCPDGIAAIGEAREREREV
jgi:hypothetical protein